MRTVRGVRHQKNTRAHSATIQRRLVHYGNTRGQAVCFFLIVFMFHVISGMLQPPTANSLYSRKLLAHIIINKYKYMFIFKIITNCKTNAKI